MKRLHSALAMATLVAVALSVTGCRAIRHIAAQHRGSGVMKSETRTVAPFTEISASGAFAIEVTCQKEQSVEITGDDNLLAFVTTTVKDSTLHLGTSSGYSGSGSIKVRISVPDLKGLNLSGAGSVALKDVKSDNLTIESSGAGSVTAAGTVKDLVVRNSGVGSLNAADLHAEDATINISGVGSADVYVTGQLEANISGMGSVKYAGDPKNVVPHVSGMGSVSKKSQT